MHMQETITVANGKRAYGALNARFGTAGRLAAARALLVWDSQTYMPSGGAWSRGEELAAIDSARKDLIDAPDTAELFQAAQAAGDSLSQLERINLEEMRRLWRHIAAVPKDLMMERARQISNLQGVWAAAKPSNDFARFAAGFERLMPLNREMAQAKAAALGLAP